MKNLKFSLNLTGLVDPKGDESAPVMTAEELKSNLQQLINLGMREGLITGETAAQREDHAITIDVEEPKTTYNHAYTIAFSVSGSTHPKGEDVTPAQLREALEARIVDLTKNGEWEEAVGAPFDTYEEQD